MLLGFTKKKKNQIYKPDDLSELHQLISFDRSGLLSTKISKSTLNVLYSIRDIIFKIKIGDLYRSHLSVSALPEKVTEA